MKKWDSLINSHIENINKILSPISNFANFFFEPRTVTVITFEINVCKKLHLNFYKTIPGASFTSSARHIEGKKAGLITSCVCLMSSCKKFAYNFISFDITNRIGTRSSTDRRLINNFYFINVMAAYNVIKLTNLRRVKPEIFRQSAVKYIVYQRTFTGA